MSTHQGHQELAMEFQRLTMLCRHFDPYHPEMTPEIENALDELNLRSLINDPFALTNEILKRLDQIQGHMKKTLQ